MDDQIHLQAFILAILNMWLHIQGVGNLCGRILKKKRGRTPFDLLKQTIDPISYLFHSKTQFFIEEYHLPYL